MTRQFPSTHDQYVCHYIYYFDRDLGEIGDAGMRVLRLYYHPPLSVPPKKRSACLGSSKKFNELRTMV